MERRQQDIADPESPEARDQPGEPRHEAGGASIGGFNSPGAEADTEAAPEEHRSG